MGRYREVMWHDLNAQTTQYTPRSRYIYISQVIFIHNHKYEIATYDFQLRAVHILRIMPIYGCQSESAVMWYKSKLSEDSEFASCNYEFC